MFGLFKKKAPLTTAQRVTLELLTRHTIDQFGAERVFSQSILRTERDLDLTGDCLDSRMQSAADKLVDRFGIDRSGIQLSIAKPEEQAEAFLYEPPEKSSDPAVAVLSPEAMEDDLRIVTSVATVFSRHAWNAKASRPADHEPQTYHLLPVLVGLGVLVSEASLYDQQWSTGGWSGWSLSRSGHYNAMEIGYTMAVLSECKSEASTAWLSDLRLDARSVARSAFSYFSSQKQRSRNMLFVAPEIPARTSSPGQLAQWLQGDDPSFAYAAALVLHALAVETPERISTQAAQALQSAIDHDDLDVATKSVQAIGDALVSTQGMHSAMITPTVEQLLKQTSSRNLSLAFQAGQAATRLGGDYKNVLDAANRLLRSESFDLIPVLRWIGDGGAACHPLSTTVRDHLRDALRFEHVQATRELVDCISRIESDPESFIRSGIADPTWRQNALSVLNERLQ